MNSRIANTTFVKACLVSSDRDELIVTFPSMTYFHFHVTAIVISVILYFSTVFLNGVSFVVIWRSRLLKEKMSNFTIAVKCFIDLGIGILVIPVYIAVLASELGGNPNCTMFVITKKTGILAFMYSTTAMSTMNFERYMAILHPLSHRVNVTNSRLLTYTASVCVCQTILLGLSLTYVDILRFVLTTIVFLFVASTVVVYVRILFFRLKNRTHPGNQLTVQCRSKEEKRKRMFKRDFEAAKICSVVMVCCLVAILPGVFSNIDRLTASTTASFSTVVRRRWFTLLFLSNATINPIIFFWTNKALRMRGIYFIKSICCRWGLEPGSFLNIFISDDCQLAGSRKIEFRSRFEFDELVELRCRVKFQVSTTFHVDCSSLSSWLKSL